MKFIRSCSNRCETFVNCFTGSAIRLLEVKDSFQFQGFLQKGASFVFWTDTSCIKQTVLLLVLNSCGILHSWFCSERYICYALLCSKFQLMLFPNFQEFVFALFANTFFSLVC